MPAVAGPQWRDGQFQRELLSVSTQRRDLHAPTQHLFSSGFQEPLQTAEVRLAQSLRNNDVAQRMAPDFVG